MGLLLLVVKVARSVAAADCDVGQNRQLPPPTSRSGRQLRWSTGGGQKVAAVARSASGCCARQLDQKYSAWVRPSSIAIGGAQL